MMVQLITDSTSDLSAADQKALDVETVNLRVIFGEQSYIDKVDITPEEFYRRLAASDAIPTTSQVSPGEFYSCFEQHLAQEKEIVYIGISGKLSGTIQSACIAKEQSSAPERVHIVDSRNVTLGLTLLVRAAARLRDEGKSAQEIVSAIEALRTRVRVVAAIDTLKYLHKGGRLSGTAKVLGSALNVKPVIAVVDGEIISEKKVLGRNKSLAYLVQCVFDTADPALPLIFANSNAAEEMQQVQQMILKQQAFTIEPPIIVGPVVGTHAGPGAVGIAYFQK